jgi:hypothetical protein
MESSAVLLWSLLFGSCGLGYFVYGRKQKKTVPVVCGVLLMFFPYFIVNTLLLALIGCILLAIPWFARF